jgi:hypothetical protein
MKKSKKKTDKKELRIPNSKSERQIDWESTVKKQPSEGELTQLADLANRLKNLQWKIDQLDTDRHALQQIVDRISFSDIPSLMEQFGLSEVKLKDGSRVTIKPFVKANLPTETALTKCKTDEERDMLRDRIDGGLEYLKKHGAESIIKNMLTVQFAKGQSALSKKAIAALAKLGIQTDVVESVHAQTLTAWVRERLQEGKPVDMNLFSVYNGNIATVETSK